MPSPGIRTTPTGVGSGEGSCRIPLGGGSVNPGLRDSIYLKRGFCLFRTADCFVSVSWLDTVEVAELVHSEVAAITPPNPTSMRMRVLIARIRGERNEEGGFLVGTIFSSHAARDLPPDSQFRPQRSEPGTRTTPFGYSSARHDSF